MTISILLERGKIISLMVLEFIIGKMEINMKENG